MANPEFQQAVNTAVDKVFPVSDESNKIKAAAITKAVSDKGTSVKPDLKDIAIISDAINKAAKETDPNLSSKEFGEKVVERALQDPKVDKAAEKISNSDGSWWAGKVKAGLIEGAKEEITKKHSELKTEIKQAQSVAPEGVKTAKEESPKPAPNKVSQAAPAAPAEPETVAKPAAPVAVASVEAEAVARTAAPAAEARPTGQTDPFTVAKTTTAPAPATTAPQMNDKGYYDLASVINQGIDAAVSVVRDMMGGSMKELESLAGVVKQGVQVATNSAPNGPAGGGERGRV